MKVGLRIDADTFRGTRYGVPNLIQILAEHAIPATFFFSVGPDNMGRHLRRLIHPSFLWKMLRSKAASLYGWDILLKGTLWPGPVIGKKLGEVMRSASEARHEVGLHAWDHHAWQAHIDTMSSEDMHRSLERGFQMLVRILGRAPACSGAPGWRCNDLTLLEKTRFPFRYNSDCRGESVFYPLVDGTALPQPQIPVTMPTYDEVIMRNGISHNNYNEYMLSLLKPDKLNVLTIHAEVEGMACFSMFERFLKMARSKGVSFVPLGTFLKGHHTPIGRSRIIKRPVQGREGWVSCQSTVEAHTGSDS
jgi:undecaprenyl phosphate-alpha-L-ara4FN deformylase